MMLNDGTPMNFYMTSFYTFEIEAVKSTDGLLSQLQIGVVHSVECSLVLYWRRIVAVVSTKILVG